MLNIKCLILNTHVGQVSVIADHVTVKKQLDVSVVEDAVRCLCDGVSSRSHLVPGTCVRRRTGPSAKPPWTTLKSRSAQRP